MRKLSKADMKKMMGGSAQGGGCGSTCFYFSGGVFRTSICVFNPIIWQAPLPGFSPTCVCKATGSACWGDIVVV